MLGDRGRGRRRADDFPDAALRAALTRATGGSDRGLGGGSVHRLFLHVGGATCPSQQEVLSSYADADKFILSLFEPPLSMVKLEDGPP